MERLHSESAQITARSIENQLKMFRINWDDINQMDRLNSIEKQQINLKTLGSTSIPYDLIVDRINNIVSIICGCKAAKFGQLCKHRLAILEGDITNIVGSQEDILGVLEWIKNSDLPKLYEKYIEASKQNMVAQEAMEKAKHHLVDALNRNHQLAAKKQSELWDVRDQTSVPIALIKKINLLPARPSC